MTQKLMTERELYKYCGAFYISGERPLSNIYNAMSGDKEALNKAFTWNMTPECDDFWYSVYNIMNNEGPGYVNTEKGAKARDKLYLIYISLLHRMGKDDLWEDEI